MYMPEAELCNQENFLYVSSKYGSSTIPTFFIFLTNTHPFINILIACFSEIIMLATILFRLQ